MESLIIEKTNFQNSSPEKTKEEKIIFELKVFLTNYLAKNPNITANAFCLKNNLSSSTINNLLSGLTKKSITSEVARKIMFGIHRGKPIGHILRDTRGELGNFLRAHYSSLIESEVSDNSDQILNQNLRTKNSRLVMMLAHNKGGTTRAEIAETLDGFALEVLDKMINDKVLYEDGQGRIQGFSDSIYLDNETTKELIQEVNYFAKPSDTPDSQIKILWGKLSPEKIQKQKELTLTFINSLREIYKEEDVNGEPSFITLTADILKQPNQKKKES